jgi:hypothetical protein
MNLLRDIARFVAWLSGSLAGTVAILYFCGYLVVLSHLYRLGIGALPGLDHRLYLEHGGRFLIDVVSAHLLPPLFFASLVGVIALGLIGLIRGWAKRHRKRLRRLSYAAQRLRSRLASPSGGPLAYGLLLVLFLLLADPFLALLYRPLQETDLLFADQPVLLSPTEAAEQLNVILGVELIVLSFLILALRLTHAWRHRALGIAPFVLVALVSLMLLPVNYGALMLEFRHHPVELDPPMANHGGTYLLAATDNLFVIWDSAHKKVLWVPPSRVNALALGAREDILLSIRDQGSSQ